MTPFDLKSLLYSYLAVLKTPGGAEHILFIIQRHIAALDLMEVYNDKTVHVRDLLTTCGGAPPRREHDSERDDLGADDLLPDGRGNE